MIVRFQDFEKYHGKRGIGSTYIRVHQLIKYWKEAELYRYGENPDVLIFQKVYCTPDYKFPAHFKGIKILDLCISGETLILTVDGWKYAKEVTETDYLITHKGRPRKVNKIYSRKSMTSLVKAANMPAISITNNHPMYTTELKTDTKSKRIIGGTSWKNPEDMKIYKRHDSGDALMSLSNINFGDKANIDNETAWILGYFMAEGTVGHHQIAFSSHINEIRQQERVIAYFSKLGNKVTRSVKENCVSLSIANKEWVSLVKNDIGTKGSKKLPPFAYKMSQEALCNMFAGYISGDGCGNKDGITVASISKKIALGMWQLMKSCGLKPSIHYTDRKGCFFEHKDGKKYIANPQWKIYLNRNDSAMLHEMVEIYKPVCEKSISKNSESISMGEYILHPLRSITEEYEKNVYNFEVEEDNSYVADGYIVHNCDADWLNGVTAIKETIDAVNAITCSSKNLVAFIKQLTDKPVIYIPDRFDLELIPKPRKHKDKAKTVVWFGYRHNAETLRTPRWNTIQSIQRLGLNLLVIADDDPMAWQWLFRQEGDNFKKNNYKYAKYQEDTFYDLLQTADFAILPNGSRPVDYFKSNNKTVKSILAGLPVAKDDIQLELFVEPENRNKYLEENYKKTKKEFDVLKSIEQYKSLIASLS